MKLRSSLLAEMCDLAADGFDFKAVGERSQGWPMTCFPGLSEAHDSDSKFHK
jgi:hypothetical protein